MITTDTALEHCFAAIERAACEGARCPKNGEFGVDTIYTNTLARQGRIKVEISGQNYRTITLLTGPNAGKRTRPDHNRVWKVIDHAGLRHVRPAPRPTGVPSPPRLLGRAP